MFARRALVALLVGTIVGLITMLNADQLTAQTIPSSIRISNGYGVGKFEYRKSNPTEGYLYVWTETVGSGGQMSRFSGIVDSKTKAHVPNLERFDLKNIAQISGRLVAAQGRLRQEGEGEAAKLYIEEVYILVLE